MHVEEKMLVISLNLYEKKYSKKITEKNRELQNLKYS
jgi:hypothetical protein